MILILCEDTDVSAHWAATALRLRGHTPKVVTATDLVSAETWHHRVGQAGATCDIRLANGDRLSTAATAGVLNRLASLPAAWYRRYGGPDRDYAAQEMHAFYLSWLHAMPGPVLNPPTPQGLCGNWRHVSAWRALGAQAGLPVRPYTLTSSDAPDAPMPWPCAQVHVVGTRVIDPAGIADRHRAACLRLAAAAGSPLIGIAFAANADGQWDMTGASVLPDLIGGGDPLADALAEALVP
jgi:hypothetical protein